MKLDVQLIGYINTFESFTHARVKDCFFRGDGLLVFVVYTGDLGKALGRNGNNIRRISRILKQRLSVIEFNADPIIFIRNLLYPLRGVGLSRENNRIVIRTDDKVLRGKIYGRDRGNLRKINEIFKKYFKYLDVVVE